MLDRYKKNSAREAKMFSINTKDTKAIYEQIIEQMKYHVAKGNLKEGDAIPSVRKMALEMNVTPGTVAKAYQELERQHVIETIRGKGTFIAAKIEFKPNEDRVQEAKSKLSSIVLELKMMGYSYEDICEMVDSIYKELGK